MSLIINGWYIFRKNNRWHATKGEDAVETDTYEHLLAMMDQCDRPEACRR